MSEPEPDPSRRVLAGKELWTALLPTAALLAGFAIGQLYSKTLGLLLVAPFFVYWVVFFWRMPRAEKARIAAALEAQKKTPWGRVERLVKLAILLCLAAVAVQWLLRQL
jgi:hypothetical protein